MCKQLKISRFGYYKWLKNGKPIFNKFNQENNDLVFKTYHQFHGVYGYKMLSLLISKLSDKVLTPKQVYRYMKFNNLQVKRKTQKFKYGLESGSFRYPNLLNRNFKATEKNQKWVTDITYIQGKNKTFYFLSIIKDLWNGEILDWQLSKNLDINFVKQNLKNAYYKNGCPKNVIIHSDQGVHYTGISWKDICEKYQLKISMSRRGNSPDNGACESWFGTFKNEVIYNINKNSLDFYELMRITNEYINFYNFIRPFRGQKRSPIEIRYDSLKTL